MIHSDHWLQWKVGDLFFAFIFEILFYERLASWVEHVISLGLNNIDERFIGFHQDSIEVGGFDDGYGRVVVREIKWLEFNLGIIIPLPAGNGLLFPDH